MRVKITSPDIEKAIKKMGDADKIVQQELRTGHTEASAFAQSHLAQYPTAPSGSSYTRTGTLGKGWTLETHAVASDINTVVSNATPYGHFVQDEPQAWMHVGRWNNTTQSLARVPQLTKIKDYFTDALSRIKTRLGNI
jgi:hypothetical protein